MLLGRLAPKPLLRPAITRPQGAGQRQSTSYKRWWAPWSRQWSNGIGKLRCFVSGASTFIGGAPSLLSCRPRPPVRPDTRQAHAYNATMAPWNLSHSLLAPLSCSLGFPMVPSGALSLYYAPSDVSWPYDPCNPYPMSYNHLVGIRMPYFTLTSH